ncbi:MAG: Wzz/FepE/Etk N-terminal domain-containing protein [Balneolales bacterium]
MHQSHLAIAEITSFIKRRKILLLLAPILILCSSITAVYILPPKYESSISFLVEKDETLNPMIQFNMAVAMASDDRLRSFNEIIYSRTTLNLLIDSLGLERETTSPIYKERLLREVRGDVRTNLRASDSFSITYTHNVPEMAKKGVELLADHFIQTRLLSENRRNKQTVEFFEYKLEDLKRAVNIREQTMIKHLQENVEQAPRDDQFVQTDIQTVESSVSEIDRRKEKLEDILTQLKNNTGDNKDIAAISKIDLTSLPSGNMIQGLIGQHREHIQRYTANYPLVIKVKSEIYDLAEQVIFETENSLFNLQTEKLYLQNQRAELTRQLEKGAEARQVRLGIESDYEIYKSLLEDMKVKVEQARSSRDIGERAENQFVVIDAANLPRTPSKPNRMMLIAGGLFIGVFLGIVAAGVAEILDTTIRNQSFLRSFEKPVVAFIPDGKKNY